jgi:hypothetical protein
MLIRLGEEKELMKMSVKRFAGACEILDELISEDYGRSWVERVLPLNTSIASLFLVSPSDWSTSEQTRAVYLYGSEPEAAGRAESRLKRW